MCKGLGPVCVKHCKYPLLLLSVYCQTHPEVMNACVLTCGAQCVLFLSVHYQSTEVKEKANMLTTDVYCLFSNPPWSDGECPECWHVDLRCVLSVCCHIHPEVMESALSVDMLTSDVSCLFAVRSTLKWCMVPWVLTCWPPMCLVCLPSDPPWNDGECPECWHVDLRCVLSVCRQIHPEVMESALSADMLAQMCLVCLLSDPPWSDGKCLECWHIGTDVSCLFAVKSTLCLVFLLSDPPRSDGECPECWHVGHRPGLLPGQKRGESEFTSLSFFHFLEWVDASFSFGLQSHVSRHCLYSAPKRLYCPRVQSHASTSVRTLKIPNTGSHTIVWTYKNTALTDTAHTDGNG